MKYNLGDKVRVKSELQVGVVYGSNIFVESMANHFGKGAIITHIDRGNGYILDIDESRYTEEMLEPFFKSKEDVVNRPSHYTQGKIEVIDFIEDQKLDFRAANVVKYTCRARYKGKELEDYKKARFYLDRLIKELENKSE